MGMPTKMTTLCKHAFILPILNLLKSLSTQLAGEFVARKAICVNERLPYSTADTYRHIWSINMAIRVNLMPFT